MHFRYNIAIFLWLFGGINIPLYINTTDSMPKGLYLVTNKKITRGSYVAVCLPHPLAQFALQQGFLVKGHCPSHTVPILKQIIANEGDHVTRTALNVTINTITLPHSYTFTHDQRNNPLPKTRTSHWLLGKKEFWLYGTKSIRSWDSRYFGPIAGKNILYVVQPVITC